jgi:hypothetical protein
LRGSRWLPIATSLSNEDVGPKLDALHLGERVAYAQRKQDLSMVRRLAR